ELNLLQLASCLMAQPGTGPSQVVRCDCQHPGEREGHPPYFASRNSSIIGTSHDVRAVTFMWSVPGSTASCACGRRRNSSTACSGRITSESPHTTSVGAVMVRTVSAGTSL